MTILERLDRGEKVKCKETREGKIVILRKVKDEKLEIVDSQTLEIQTEYLIREGFCEEFVYYNENLKSYIKYLI